MRPERMAAFSDGVLAIVITIMVLELKVPHGSAPGEAWALVGIFGGYLMSFLILGTYWMHHHHLCSAIQRVDARVLWANHVLLFAASLIPFATGWMSESGFAAFPTAMYGIVLLSTSLAYLLFEGMIARIHRPNSLAFWLVGDDNRGRAAPLLYSIAIPTAFWSSIAACAIYLLVGLILTMPPIRAEMVESLEEAV